MNTVTSVSVIVPTLNEEKYLPVLLESLKLIDSPLEVIVVDGGSEDKTVALVEKAKESFGSQSSLKVVALDRKGISMQRNIGAREATGKLLLFCDADIVAPSTAEHERMVESFVKNNYVLATGRIVPLEKTVATVMMYHLAFGLQVILMILGRPYFGGAYLLTDRKTFFAAGGFDERLRVSEDIDYCLRANEFGKCKLFHTPIRVSMRRYEKYGFSWLFENPKTLMHLLVKGRIKNEEKIYYPFGEY